MTSHVKKMFPVPACGHIDIAVMSRRITRQTLYVYCNIEGRSRNHCCRGKAIRTKYYVCACVCVGGGGGLNHPACKAHAPYYIVICGLSGSNTLLPHYLINNTIFGNKSLDIKCVFSFSLQLSSLTFLILRRIQRDIIINV